MADVKVENKSSETRPQGRQQESQQHERGGTPVTRRGEYWPAPRDMFTMNPFAMMRRLTEEMDRSLLSSIGLGRGHGGDVHSWAPAVEVTEREGNLVVCAELPGMGKEDVKVEVTDEGLVIEGEKKREHEEERGGYHRTERSYGHFYRLIALPEGADTEKAHAEFRNGVLEVRVPVPESHRKARQIPISK